VGTRITVTPTAILVRTGEDRRQQGGRIGGGIWDSDHGYWVYPHDDTTLDELVVAFGEDLDELKFDPTGKTAVGTPPTATPQRQTDTQPSGDQEDALSRELLEEVASAVGLLRQTAAALPDLTAIRDRLEPALAPLQEEIGELKARISDLLESQSRDTALGAAIERSDQELSRVREKVKQLERALASAKSEHESRVDEIARLKERESWMGQFQMQRRVLDLGKVLSGEEPEYLQIIDGVDIEHFRRIPLVLHEKLRARLERALHASGSTAVERSRPGGPDLFDLLREAQRSGFLDSRSLNAAHFFRINRTKIAHPVDPREGHAIHDDEVLALAAGCIIAAAIVWGSLKNIWTEGAG